MRLYKKCDTEVIATIKKNSHHKFDNAITILLLLHCQYFPALTTSKMVSKLSLASTGITDQGTKERLPLAETKIVLLMRHKFC